MSIDVPAAEEAMRDALVDRLRARGIRYLGGGRRTPALQALAAEPIDALIAALARSRDARLRSALVALLLRHPEFALTASRIADRMDDPYTARLIRVSILAAAALQRFWAFSLDLYLPGWTPINAGNLAAQFGVPPPSEDYGRATLRALDRLLAGDSSAPPDYYGAWHDVGRHVIYDLREEGQVDGAP